MAATFEAVKVSEHVYWVRVMARSEQLKKYRCTVCGYIYDPAVGDPEGDIKPGTAFEELPDTWVCPVCGVGKEDFEPAD